MKQEYRYEYRNANGDELETDKIVTGPVTLEEAIAYVQQCIRKLPDTSDTDHVLIVDENWNVAEKIYVHEPLPISEPVFRRYLAVTDHVSFSDFWGE